MLSLTVTLSDAHAARLRRLAAAAAVSPEALAADLLAAALDAAVTTAQLDAIPGAHDRAQLGLAQTQSGRTLALADL